MRDDPDDRGEEIEAYIAAHLDPVRQSLKNRQEEYEQELAEFEEHFGEKAREAYEENYA